MRTAREVLQESIGDLSDAALADLRAEGLVIVAAADLRIVIDGEWSKASDAEIVAAFDRARAALAAGGE